MTWIRWECSSPSHESVGALAEALKVEPAQALGHCVAVCCGFGDHQQSGDLAVVSDTTLELWALWRGKRGAFAAAFRAQFTDEHGHIRGWWRQEKLLQKQIADRSKPDGRKNRSPDNPPEIPRESPQNPAGDLRGIFGGNEDGDGNELRTTHPPPPARAMAEAGRTASDTPSPEPQPAETALLARFAEPSDRDAVAAFLDGVPADQLREGWVGILGACLEGLGLEGGSAASPSAVAWACREHRTKRRDYDSRLFRRFVESAARTLSRSPPARRASDTASSTATPNGTPPRATPALKIRRVNTA